MASPLFNAFGNGQDNMLSQFSKFMSEMQGKNPTEEINKLLRSGKISQQQLNQVQQKAQQMQNLFAPFFRK